MKTFCIISTMFICLVTCIMVMFLCQYLFINGPAEYMTFIGKNGKVEPTPLLVVGGTLSIIFTLISTGMVISKIMDTKEQ